MTNIQQALINFCNDFEFNGMLYYQQIMDALRKTDYIEDIGGGVKVFVESYNTKEKRYEEPVELVSRYRLKSGYIRLLDLESANTVNTDNIKLAPYSEIDSYN